MPKTAVLVQEKEKESLMCVEALRAKRGVQ
jgi:hypothetical protein